MRKDKTIAVGALCKKKGEERIAKDCYVFEWYFDLSHLHGRAFRAQLTAIAEDVWNVICRGLVFNLFREPKIVTVA